jgi:hypothetical protein
VVLIDSEHEKIRLCSSAIGTGSAAALVVIGDRGLQICFRNEKIAQFAVFVPGHILGGTIQNRSQFRRLPYDDTLSRRTQQEQRDNNDETQRLQDSAILQRAAALPNDS